jgi:hypothetical protein
VPVLVDLSVAKRLVLLACGSVLYCRYCFVPIPTMTAFDQWQHWMRLDRLAAAAAVCLLKWRLCLMWVMGKTRTDPEASGFEGGTLHSLNLQQHPHHAPCRLLAACLIGGSMHVQDNYVALLSHLPCHTTAPYLADPALRLLCMCMSWARAAASKGTVHVAFARNYLLARSAVQQGYIPLRQLMLAQDLFRGLRKASTNIAPSITGPAWVQHHMLAAPAPCTVLLTHGSSSCSALHAGSGL